MVALIIIVVVIWLVVVGLGAPGRARKARRALAAQTAQIALPEAEKIRRYEADKARTERNRKILAVVVAIGGAIWLASNLFH